MKLKHCLFVLSLAWLPLSVQALERMTWQVGGLQREALVHLPEDPKDAPLVFGFHGHGGKAQNAARKFDLHGLWPEAVVVYMQGLPTPGRLTDPEGKKSGWQHARGERGDRDLAFFDAVVKTMREAHGIDPLRVFATGHSNGGGFCYLLWVTRPGLFAAIAPSAAGARALRSASPEPLPVMHFAGRNDPLVQFRNQKATMRRVCQVNACGGEAAKWSAQCKSYDSGGVPLVACIHDGNHGYPEFAPHATVRFFREHRRVQ
jgi:polyhydroxybutyrate depolymerase